MQRQLGQSRVCLRAGWVLLVAVLFALPAVSSGQEMTFEPDEPLLRAYVVLLENTAVDRRGEKLVLGNVSDAVFNYGGYEVLTDRDVKRSLGGRGWRTLTRCSTVECYLESLKGAEVDRVIFVKIGADDAGVTTVDLELDSVADGQLIRFTAAATDDITNSAYLEGPMNELLTPEPPPEPEPEPAPVAETPPTIPEDLPEEPKEDDGPTNVWAWVAGGTGVGLIALGVIFGLSADNTQSEIQASPHDRAEVQDLIDSGETQALLANMCFGLGLAGVATGAVLYFYYGEDAATAESAPGASAPSLVVGGSSDGVVIGIDVGF